MSINRRQARLVLLRSIVITCLAGLALGLLSCGGGSGSHGGTSVKTYNLTITGINNAGSTKATRTVKLMLTVQQTTWRADSPAGRPTLSVCHVPAHQFEM